MGTRKQYEVTIALAPDVSAEERDPGVDSSQPSKIIFEPTKSKLKAGSLNGPYVSAYQIGRNPTFFIDAIMLVR